MISQIGASLCCTGRSMETNLTSMLRSRSWDISIPLARKTLDMQDLYPWKEDIASFFSSTGRWGNQLLLDSCLDRINCLTWHDSPLAWEDLLEQFLPGGRVIGKSNGRSNRSGNSSWLGLYAYAYRPFQFWTRLSTFQDVSSRMGETYIANFLFLPRANRSTNGLPQARKILSATVWFRLQSVLRIWPLLDRWSANTFRCPGRKQGTRVIPLFSGHRHNSVAKSFIASDLVPPPDFSGRQPLTCCRTWEQPSTIGH